jgi:hypothetical protein
LSDTRFDLIEGSFDVALCSTPLQDIRLRGRKLADVPRILCAAPDYLALQGAPQTPGDLPGHDFLAWTQVTPRELIYKDGWRATLDPWPMVCRTILNDGSWLRVATVAGGGQSVADDIANDRLIHVRPDWRQDAASVL